MRLDHTVDLHLGKKPVQKAMLGETPVWAKPDDWGYGGTTTAKNAASAPIIDLDYYGVDRLLWLPGTTGNYVSTPDLNEMDYESSTFDTTAGGWDAADKIYGQPTRSVYDPSKNMVINPFAESNTSNVGAHSSTLDATVERIVNSGSPVSDTAFRFTYPAAPTRTWGYVGVFVNRNFLAGERWKISLWARKSNPEVTATSISLRIMDGNSQNQNSPASTYSVLHSEWKQITHTFTVGSNPTTANLLFIQPGSVSDGRQFDITGIQLEKGESTQPLVGHTGKAMLSTKTSSRKQLTGLSTSQQYTSSAYIFPPADGTYSISMPSAPTPTTESGPGRRYAQAKNGAGVLVEEGTVNLLPGDGSPIVVGVSGTGASVVEDLDRVFETVRSWRLTLGTGSTSAGLMVGNKTLPLKSGETYVYSSYVKAPAGTTLYRVYTATNGASVTPDSAYTGSFPATGDWQRVFMKFRVDAEGEWSNSSIYPAIRISVDNSHYLATGFQLERKSYATTFTDGSLGTGYSYVSTTNLAPNPSFEIDTSGWSAPTLASSVSLATDISYHGSQSLRVTRAGAGAVYPKYFNAPIPSNISHITVSGYVRDENFQMTSSQVYIYFVVNGVEDIDNPDRIGPVFTPTAGGWTRISHTRAVPPGATHVNFISFSNGNGANGTSYVTDAWQVEARDFVTPFGTGTHGGVAGYPSERGKGHPKFTASSDLTTSGTMLFFSRSLVNSTGTSRHLLTIGSSGEDRLLLFVNSTGNLMCHKSATSQAISNLGPHSDYLSAAVTFDSTQMKGFAFSETGGLVTSVGATPSVVSTGTQVSVGNDYSTNGLFPAHAVFENVMIFNTRLSDAEITNILNGTTLPSVAANRADCVFSAFVNDPTQEQTLTGGAWHRLVKMGGRDKNTQSDVVILGPEGQQFYVDSVQVEKGAVSSYTPPIRFSGDFDIRAHLAMEKWIPSSETVFFETGWGTGFWLAVTTSGALSFGMQFASGASFTSLPNPDFVDGEKKWVRVVRTGAEIQFYLSNDGITWTAQGSPTSNRAGTILPSGSLRVGHSQGTAMKGKMFSAEIRAGVDGPIVARYDANQHTGTTYTDSAGKVWSITRSGDATAEVVDRNTWAFTGAEYLTLPDRDALDAGIGQPITIAAALKTRSTVSVAPVVTKGILAGVSSTPGYGLFIPSGSARADARGPDLSYRSSQTTAPINTGGMTVVGFERQATSLRAYRNGIATPALTIQDTTLADPGPLQIGRIGTHSSLLNALVSWTALFRRTLTEDEHLQLAAWDGTIENEPIWLRGEATLYVNADDAETRRVYRESNLVLNLAFGPMGVAG